MMFRLLIKLCPHAST